MSYNHMSTQHFNPPNVRFKVVQPPSPLAGLTNRTANCVLNYLGHYDEVGNLLGIEKTDGFPAYKWKDYPKSETKARLLALYNNGALYVAAKHQQRTDAVLGWRNFGWKCFVELCRWLGVTPQKRTPKHKMVLCPHCHKTHFV